MKTTAALPALVVLLTGTLVAPPPASALTALPCDPKGVPAADAWNASQLSPALTGRMHDSLSAYRISCARVVTQVVRDRGLPIRAAELAVTTIITEATMDNLDGGDGTSVGLFQQTEGSYGNIDRNDPVAATNAFLNAMLREFPDGSWQTRPFGEVCQKVQRSAYPDRYAPEAHDGVLVARAVWDRSPSNLAVYRPTDNTFYIRKLDGTPLTRVSLGVPGDLPAVGHYERGNFDNLAVYRPSAGAFVIRWADGRTENVPFGQAGDLPATGRYENVEYDNLAVYRPSDRTFHIRRANESVLKVPFPGAQDGDVPAVGHYELSNYDNLALYRPSEGAYYIRWANGRIERIAFGAPGDRPAPAHFQAGPYTNLAVYRQQSSTFHIRRADNTVAPVVFGDGTKGDVPAVGKFE
ncbi:hypothetical protein [Nonomuraea sp. NPDC001699]